MSDLLADRRRAVVLWVGDHERAGAAIRVGDIYSELVKPRGLFADDMVLLAVIRDLEGSGHVRDQIDSVGLDYAYALTERGREFYAQLRASTAQRLGGRLGGPTRWILAAVMLALIGAATQWFFDWLPLPAQ